MVDLVIVGTSMQSGLFISILGAMEGNARASASASELQPFFLCVDEPTLEKPGHS